MNERIDKLIEQCTTQQFSDCVGGYETFDKEKFAELLIRECVTKMALEIMDEQWVDDAVKNTYTHFGVEW